jgi:tetratricopeptide (TPR) repeat protein
MGLANYKKNKFSQALEYYDKSLTKREALNQKESTEYADTLHNRGIVYKKLNNFDGALESYLESLGIK